MTMTTSKKPEGLPAQTGGEYRERLAALGLPLTGRLTCRLLGISTRMAAYYAAGRPIAPPVMSVLRLLELLRRLGIEPRDLVDLEAIWNTIDRERPKGLRGSPGRSWGQGSGNPRQK